MADNKNLLEYWQKLLGLQDWTIVLKDNCRPDEMLEDNTCGCVDFSECGKAALVQILDPKYYGERITPFDYEQTLIHELMHLKLSLVSADVSDLQERYMHQIIDDLARAFVAARRGGYDEHPNV